MTSALTVYCKSEHANKLLTIVSTSRWRTSTLGFQDICTNIIFTLRTSQPHYGFRTCGRRNTIPLTIAVVLIVWLYAMTSCVMNLHALARTFICNNIHLPRTIFIPEGVITCRLVGIFNTSLYSLYRILMVGITCTERISMCWPA